MLAQNFKTAADLRISDGDLAGLIKTLGMLERDEVRHVAVPNTWKIQHNPTPDMLFNMGNIYLVVGCKTAACIAGTADLFCGTEFVVDEKLRSGLPEELHKLFCPPISEDDWGTITVEEAARAIRSYLTTGEANWAEALT